MGEDFASVFRDYIQHIEAEMCDSNGERCSASTAGLLERRPVRVSKSEYVSKEMNRMELEYKDIGIGEETETLYMQSISGNLQRVLRNLCSTVEMAEWCNVTPRTARYWVEDINSAPQKHLHTIVTALKGKLQVQPEQMISEVVEERKRAWNVLVAFILQALPLSQLASLWDVPIRTLHRWKAKGNTPLSHPAFHGWYQIPVSHVAIVLGVIVWLMTLTDRDARKREGNDEKQRQRK